MDSNLERKSRIKRTIAGFMVLAALALTLVSVSYSWIRRQWTPSVSGSNIRIEANGALAFKLEEGSAIDSINLTDGLGTGFVLKPVSNSSGESEDFFSLDRSENDVLKYSYQHVVQDAGAANWKSAASKNGYIETSFYILYGDGEGSSGSGTAEGGTEGGGGTSDTDGRLKYVYLDTAKLENSLAGTLDAAQAARVSITVQKTTNDEYTYIFGKAENTNAKAITDEKNGDAWVAQGVTYYLSNGDVRDRLDNGAPLHKNVHVEDMKYYNGGFITKEQNGKEVKYVDPDRCLFLLQSRTANKKVTVRVWLEGCDDRCTDEIAGLQLDLLLSFAAADCTMNTETIDGKQYHRVIEMNE